MLDSPMPRFPVAPSAVHETLARHVIPRGLPLVLDLARSSGSFARDAATGEQYLDMASFYGSNPLGYAHPLLRDEETRERLAITSQLKVGNPDLGSVYMAEFVETLSHTAAPPHLPRYFFVEGGALAVENAMKTAFDWKVQKSLARGLGERGSQILHFERAFHGRSGYTLSVTNTDPAKTRYFPKFDWPRIPAPVRSFSGKASEGAEVEQAEADAVQAIEREFDERAHDIAAILIEPIQCEGGDRHFRPEFLRKLRKIADEREALLIFDEVQTGVAASGKWWAHEHTGVRPDALAFAKKLQVGGVLAGKRLDEVDNVFRVPSRISSTWGGALVDMVRATRVLEIIEQDRLMQNATERGTQLLSGLTALSARAPELTAPRGLGLLVAFDLPSTDHRARFLARAYTEKLLLLSAGERTVRLRPHLAVSAEDIAEALRRIAIALEQSRT